MMASLARLRVTLRPFRALLIAAVLAAGALGTPRAARQPQPEPLLLTGARILDVRAGRYLQPSAVLVNGNRIQGITATTPAVLPPNTRRIDLAGATLVPGLGDMFAAASPDLTADADFYYAMALAHGVTQYRVVGARLPWAASERDRARSGQVLAPRLSIGGPRLDERASPSFHARMVADLASARREVGEQARLGAEWISVGPATQVEVYRTIVRAAHAARLRVSGQPGLTPVSELVRMGVDAIDRVGFFGRSTEECEKELKGRPDFPTTDREAVADYLWRHASGADLRPVLPKAVRGQLTVVPLLASFNGVLDAADVAADPSIAALPARWREGMTARAHAAGWPGEAGATAAAAARGRLVASLAAAGARLVTGVDVESAGFGVPGAGVHREMALLVKAGLSPADAIRAATVNCADMLGTGATLGQIRTGFEADFFAVEGDPLASIGDLRRIKLVVRGGEALNPGDLLAQAKRAAR